MINVGGVRSRHGYDFSLNHNYYRRRCVTKNKDYVSEPSVINVSISPTIFMNLLQHALIKKVHFIAHIAYFKNPGWG